jgi:hypothetical protein
MDLTDFRHGQPGSCELLADRSARSSWRISRVACEFPLSRAIVITPVEPMRSGCVGPRRRGLLLSGGGSASTSGVFGACSTFTRVMARRLAELPKQPFDVEGSRPFVASRSASTASWGTTSFQVWVSHPRDLTDLSRRTPEAPAPGYPYNPESPVLMSRDLICCPEDPEICPTAPAGMGNRDVLGAPPQSHRFIAFQPKHGRQSHGGRLHG